MENWGAETGSKDLHCPHPSPWKPRAGLLLPTALGGASNPSPPRMHRRQTEGRVVTRRCLFVHQHAQGQGSLRSLPLRADSLGGKQTRNNSKVYSPHRCGHNDVEGEAGQGEPWHRGTCICPWIPTRAGCRGVAGRGLQGMSLRNSAGGTLREQASGNNVQEVSQ